MRGGLKKWAKAGRIEEFLAGLSAEELLFLQHDWQIWARDEQLPPQDGAPGDEWTTWLILGGRGAGKTRAGAEWVRGVALGIEPFASMPLERIALVGETLSDARSVMVEGVSGLLAIHANHERPVFEPSKRRLVWPNGSVAQLFSAEDPESLRGPQFAAAWCDELAKWRHGEAAFDMLQFALRLGQRPRQVVTTTPRATPLLKRLLGDKRTTVTRMATRANAANLAPGFLDVIVARYLGTRLGRQELDGELLEDREDALWRRADIDLRRVSKAPELERIVVAVDPPVTSGKSADACGIVAAGLGVDGRGYVLGDHTVREVRPLDWARASVRAFCFYEADRLIAEVNQGGELVAAVIAQVDDTIPLKMVRANRGKWLRAEPIAALYEQGRVSHVGSLPSLEDEMCDFGLDGLSGGGSPDRMDALVWALGELFGASGLGPRVRRI